MALLKRPCRLDHRAQLLELGIPAQFRFCEIMGCDELSWVAGSARSIVHLDRNTRDLANRSNDLAIGIPPPASQIVSALFQLIHFGKGGDVCIRDIDNVHIIADAGAVTGVVISAEEREALPLARGVRDAGLRLLREGLADPTLREALMAEALLAKQPLTLSGGARAATIRIIESSAAAVAGPDSAGRVAAAFFASCRNSRASSTSAWAAADSGASARPTVSRVAPNTFARFMVSPIIMR